MQYSLNKNKTRDKFNFKLRSIIVLFLHIKMEIFLENKSFMICFSTAVLDQSKVHALKCSMEECCRLVC